MKRISFITVAAALPLLGACQSDPTYACYQWKSLSEFTTALGQPAYQQSLKTAPSYTFTSYLVPEFVRFDDDYVQRVSHKHVTPEHCTGVISDPSGSVISCKDFLLPCVPEQPL